MRSLNRLKGKGVITPRSGHHGTVTEEIKFHRIDGSLGRITARQQFVICNHKLRPLVVVINVLPAPSDRSRQTSWSEFVLSVSGIITLLTVCLAPFTVFYVLSVYSSLSVISVMTGCCQWQHFLPHRSRRQLHAPLLFSVVTEVCYD